MPTRILFSVAPPANTQRMQRPTRPPRPSAPVGQQRPSNEPPLCAATWSPRRLARAAPNWMFCVRLLPQASGPASALDLPVCARTRRDGPGCRSTGRFSGRGDPVSLDQARPGRHRRLSAWRSIASSSGSAPISRTSCAQRQATAILAAHCSASWREGTSTSVNPPMACGYGPSVTAPPGATMSAGWFPGRRQTRTRRR
jgi:hypothetical protein